MSDNRYINNHIRKIQDNKNEKIKFINNNNNNNFEYNLLSSNSNPIDIESSLKMPINQFKSKTSIEIDGELQRNNYGINYNNKLENNNNNNKNNNYIYNDKPYTGPGRGIGNLDISENVRFGIDTRRFNDEYRNINEGIIQDRFDIIDSDIQNPNNVVLPFPQGGIQTRITKSLINENKKKKFNFKY